MTEPNENTTNYGSNGSEQGLYDKYEVKKDGEPVESCFVLEPESDSAAREALWTYADETDDGELANDLKEWLLRTVGAGSDRSTEGSEDE